jgi:hypothetical protein
MSILIFALLVIIVAALVVYAVSAYLPIVQPFNNIICFLVILVAAVAIINRLGFPW